MKYRRDLRVMFKLPIVVERGESGFIYVRSPLIPGLLVGSHEEAIAVDGVHLALNDLSQAAMRGEPLSTAGDMFAKIQGANTVSVLDDLEAEVSRTPTVVDSLSTLITNLTAKIGEETQALANAGVDTSRIQHVLDVAAANNARLAKLVTDSTPSATPEETPAPVDVPAPAAAA